MTIIPDVYDKIGNILKELRSNLGVDATFTTNELYTLYVQLYPADEEMMRERQKAKPGAHSLEGYLNGMVNEYFKRTDGHNLNRPAIEFLREMTYRFV